MTVRTNTVATCPFQPVPIPAAPSVLTPDPLAGARLPSNVCVEDRCRLWMRAFDGTGRLVGAYCAFAGLVAGVGQLCGLVAQLGAGGSPGELKIPPKPTA